MTNGWTLRYYFVAFIDVLGQSKELLKLSKLPETQTEIENTAYILDNTAGNINRLRNGFNTYYEARNKPTGILDSLPPEQKTAAEKIRRAEAIIKSLSDTVIIAIPLSNEDEHCLSITSIHSALYGICGIYLAALAQHKPFRCGIDVGLCVPLTEHEVYGPALVKAYSLEHNIALYPRIVIGDSLSEYINTVERINSDTLYAKWAKRIAGECKALITKDYDTLRILDVIGSGVQSIPGGIDKPIVEKAYKFTVESHENYIKKGDSKLSSRYNSLRSYFESKLSLWNIQPIVS